MFPAIKLSATPPNISLTRPRVLRTAANPAQSAPPIAATINSMITMTAINANASVLADCANRLLDRWGVSTLFAPDQTSKFSQCDGRGIVKQRRVSTKKDHNTVTVFHDLVEIGREKNDCRSMLPTLQQLLPDPSSAFHVKAARWTFHQ